MDDPTDLSIYVHWPFCEAICPYCDFNVRLARNIDHQDWRSAYLECLRSWADVLSGRRVTSVFFGGGTPSLMEPQTVADILDGVAKIWTLPSDVEVSLEANPTSVEAARFRDFAAAGINRLSLGLQALNDVDLQRLGRRHSSADGHHALDISLKTFDNTSFDLIYGRPGQSIGVWQEELSAALELGASHVSAYQLTIETGTPFAHQVERGRLTGLPDEGLSIAFFRETETIAETFGFHKYETSNFARPGAESRHNTVYWEAGDWLGIGPGAHGRVTHQGQRLGTEGARSLSDWRQTIGDHPLEAGRVDCLTPEAAAEEILFSGLRLTKGLPLARMEKWGYRPASTRLLALQQDGLITTEDDILKATSDGHLLVDSVVTSLVPLEALR